MTQVRRRSSAIPPATVSVHTRRAYADGRNGQLHLTTAYPSGGGFDERTALVCLHPQAATGAWFKMLLPELGRERSVYAPDLPAHGHSDPSPGTPLTLTDHVAAIGDFLDGMRLRAVDLLGMELGAVVAAELAAQRPQQVRRAVLVAMPDMLRISAPPRTAAARLALMSQQTLLLYPADLPATARRLDPAQPQHVAMNLAQRTDELCGSGAATLAQLLRNFLDQ